MMDIDESSLPSTVNVKEERLDDDVSLAIIFCVIFLKFKCIFGIQDFFDRKFEVPKRGRSRSLSKKNADKVDIRAKLGKIKFKYCTSCTMYNVI